MSKINELIQTLCPDGVEYKKLGELCSICTGTKPKRILTEEASVDYINAGTSRSGYCMEVNCKGNVTTTPSRGQGGIGYVGYQCNDFWLGPLCYAIRSVDIKVLADKYIYYWLSSKDYVILSFVNEGGTPSLNKSDLEKIEIPVPPLPVQEEIVRILDEYIDLEAELEAKLSEEVELKQKQYEFYLEKLLTFSDTVEWKRLSDCCKKIGDGLHGTPVYDLISDYYFINGNNLKNEKIVIDEKTKRVNKESFMKYMLELDDNTLLMSINGTIGNLAMYHGENVILGKSVAYMSVIDTVLRRDFLYYFLQTTYTKQLLFQNVTGGTIKNLGLAVIRNFQIPVPSPTEQQRIVKILDKYDTYTRDMISALNTELESRKKQYAYYRDQLLTFKRKE